MDSLSILIFCLAWGVCFFPLFSQLTPQVRELRQIKTPKEKFHIYLLIGQSNMAGRGIVEPQDTIGNERILRMNRDGNWDVAKDPIHFDKSEAGVGPGLAFACEMLKEQEEDVTIGLLPCAAGGTNISIWLNDDFWHQTKTYPYNNMLLRTKLALKDGTLKGIIWHQGEGDAFDEELMIVYKERLIHLINQIRIAFDKPNLPFIVGELPCFNSSGKRINPILHEIKENVVSYDVVSGSDLHSLSDKVHLDAASARELGKRYAEKLKNINY